MQPHTFVFLMIDQQKKRRWLNTEGSEKEIEQERDRLNEKCRLKKILVRSGKRFFLSSSQFWINALQMDANYQFYLRSE